MAGKAELVIRLKQNKFMKEAKKLAVDISKIALLAPKKDKEKVGVILGRIDKRFRSWLEVAEKAK